MTNPRLVVVTGAIASGKDAVSRALAEQLEAEGLRAAVVGLDELWEMLHHEHPRKRSDLSHWLLARKVAALLTDEFLSSGMDAVIVNGPFFTEEERTQYLDHLKTPVEPFFVTLRVGFEESHRRAQLDPGRVASKDRAWLAERYQLTEKLLGALSERDMIVSDRRPDRCGCGRRDPNRVGTDATKLRLGALLGRAEPCHMYPEAAELVVHQPLLVRRRWAHELALAPLGRVDR